LRTSLGLLHRYLTLVSWLYQPCGVRSSSSCLACSIRDPCGRTMFPFLKKADKSPEIATDTASSSPTVGSLGPGMRHLAEASLATFESLWRQLKLLLHTDGSSQPGSGERSPQRATQDCDAPLQYVDKLCLLLASERPLDAAEQACSEGATDTAAVGTAAATRSPCGSVGN